MPVETVGADINPFSKHKETNYMPVKNVAVIINPCPNLR